MDGAVPRGPLLTLVDAVARRIDDRRASYPHIANERSSGHHTGQRGRRPDSRRLPLIGAFSLGHGPLTSTGSTPDRDRASSVSRTNPHRHPSRPAAGPRQFGKWTKPANARRFESVPGGRRRATPLLAPVAGRRGRTGVPSGGKDKACGTEAGLHDRDADAGEVTQRPAHERRGRRRSPGRRVPTEPLSIGA